MAKNTYNKGDYIHTIPLACVVVKGITKDMKQKVWYSVRDSGNHKFKIQEALVKGLATKSEIRLFQERYNNATNKLS
jgi:hypothetical protein